MLRFTSFVVALSLRSAVEAADGSSFVQRGVDTDRGAWSEEAMYRNLSSILIDVHDRIRTHGKVRLDYVASALRELHDRAGGRIHFFVILSEPHSGSTMLQTLLDSHPNVRAFGELFSPLERSNNRKVGSFDELRDVYRYIKNRECIQYDCTQRTTVGFKLMLEHIEEGSVSEPYQHRHGATFIPHYRRNILRRAISEIPGNPCAGESSTGCIHPENETDAQRLRQPRRLEPAGLIGTIQSGIGLNFKHFRFLRQEHLFHRRCLSAYEDWVDPRSRSKQMNDVEECLGLSREELSTPLVAIHQSLPMNETISNYEEVRRVLESTQYAYMLENSADPDEVFESLKHTDALFGIAR